MKIRSKESQKWRGRGANSHWCFKSSLETIQKFENRHALPNPGEQELKSKRKDWIPSLKFHETYKNYKWQIGIMKKYHDCWKRVKRAEERKGGGGSSTTHMFFLNQRGKNKHDPGKQSWLLGSTWLLFLWLCVFPKSSSKTKSIFKRKKRKQKKNEEKKQEIGKWQGASCCFTRGSKRPKKYTKPIPNRKHDTFQNSDNYFSIEKNFSSIIVQMLAGSNKCFRMFFKLKKYSNRHAAPDISKT